jgi:putative tryptophan/tyrosine transport system substrate-binding protein
VKRRNFITLLGGATAAWPLALRAQPTRRIAVLTAYIEGDPEAQRRVDAFQQGLERLGWTKASNIDIDYRYAAADAGRIRSYATALIALKPDVILAVGTPILQTMQRLTRTVPIVFVQVDDLLSTGVVASLARPGGNITGFSPFELSMGGKMLGILKEVAPSVSRVAVVLNPDAPPHLGTWRAIEAAAPGIGVEVIPAGVRNLAEIERSIDAFAQQPNGGLLVLSYTLANVHRKAIIKRAERHNMPAIYPFRHVVADGGLVSYGIDPADQFREAASYVDRILRGEKAGDLPVQGPTKFQLVINLKTAKALGLTIPDSFQLRADEVIE